MNLFKKIKKVFSLPPRKTIAYANAYLRQNLRRLYFSLGLKKFKGLNSYCIEGKDFNYFLKRNSIFGNFWAEHLNKNISEDGKNKVTKEADKICERYFNLLGSGEKNLGKKINWHQDFKTGRVWPLKWTFSLPFGEGDGTDIKVPWELSRFYHGIILAKAYINSRDKKYAQEFMGQVEDWQENNPLYLGPNWMNAMEAGIRISNLILAYEIFKSAGAKFGQEIFSKNFVESFLRLVAEHGEFIFDNLENKGTKSNHYISDLAGLLYIGAIYPELKQSKKWLDYATVALQKELQDEVYEDGVDYESSIYYHRLVAELFGHAGLIFKLYGLGDGNSNYFKRLEKMIEFAANYIKPNGLAPIIGDNDDGRLHLIFDKSYFDWDNRDHRHLLELGWLLFGKEFGGSGSRGFENGQVYILRSDNIYVAIDAGNVGQGGNGGHAHNDVFSFEYNFKGKDFIVDPGTYSYTAYPQERNLFRSTKMHSTVCIDGEEQNRFSKELLFMMTEDANPKVLNWSAGGDRDVVEAEHYGYKRLNDPVIHKRYFELDKNNGIFSIKDICIGKGMHSLEWNFHFNSQVEVRLSEQDKNSLKYVLVKEGVEVNLEFYYPEKAQVRAGIVDSWVSPRYGIKVPAKALNLKFEGAVDGLEFLTYLKGLSSVWE